MNAEDFKKLPSIPWEEVWDYDHELIYVVNTNTPNVGYWAGVIGLDFRGEEPSWWVTDENFIHRNIYKSDVESGKQLVFSQKLGIDIEARQKHDRIIEKRKD